MAGEFEWIFRLPKDLIHLPLGYTWVNLLIVEVVIVAVAMEVADVTVMVEVVIADIMVVEVTAVDMEAEVAHLLLTAEHPDVITDHALVLTVLVDTKN